MKIVDLKVTLEQEEDCCGRVSEDSQHIVIEVQDGGGGPYLVLETSRWAIDDIDAFTAKLREILAQVESVASLNGDA